jgi:hypothetical protein
MDTLTGAITLSFADEAVTGIDNLSLDRELITPEYEYKLLFCSQYSSHYT